MPALTPSANPLSAPFVRLWKGFLNGRVFIAICLLLLQALETRLQVTAHPWVWLICSTYLLLTVWMRATATDQPPPPQVGIHWLPLIGVDIAAVCLLQLLQMGSINYSPLLAIPVLLASVLGSLLLAMATTAGVSLLLLAWLVWQTATGNSDSSQAYYQTAFVCAGYFAVAYLTHELARRVERERALALLSRQYASTQEQVNALVIQHLNDGVFIVDPDFRVMQANPSALRLLGLRLEHHLPFALDMHKDWQQLQGLVAQSFARAEPLASSLHLRHSPSQSTVGLHVRTWLTQTALPGLPAQAASDTLAAHNTPPQRPVCVVFLHDLREMEARLRTEKLAAMGRMSAAVAHEIRNPLAAITQANALLAEDLAQQPAQMQLCRMVAQNAERLNRIAEEVLNIARVQQHIGDPPASALELDSQVAQICQEWLQQGPTARLAVLQLDAGVQQVLFDAEHLRRVLVNLLDNAQRHRSDPCAPQTLHILTGAPAGGQAWLQIWSDGPALEPSVHRHLFEPFFSSQSRSSGLGLYICRELCERHDASIAYQRLSRNTPTGAVEGNAFSVIFRNSAQVTLPASLFDTIVV